MFATGGPPQGVIRKLGNKPEINLTLERQKDDGRPSIYGEGPPKGAPRLEQPITTIPDQPVQFNRFNRE